MTYLEYDNTNIQNITYDKTIISDKVVAGACELGKCEIQLINDSNEYSSFKGNWISTPFGSMYIYDVAPVQEKINIKLSCYDIKQKLEVPYDKEQFESIFPCKIKEWRQAIAGFYDIEFNDNDNYPNAEYELDEHPYVGDAPSLRNVLQQISEACCSAVDNDFQDRFYFAWFDDNKNVLVNDWLNLTTENNSTEPINVVVLGRGEVEDIVPYPNPVPENAKEFRIDNNYILDPQDADSETDRREEMIEAIYNRVTGLSYVIYEMTTQDIEDYSNLELLGSKVNYTDIWGNNVNSYIMSIKYKYLGGSLNDLSSYEITISASEMKNSSSEYSYGGNLKEQIYKLGVYVDKENKRIISEIEDTEGNLNRVEQSLEGINTTINSVRDDLSDNYYNKNEIDLQNQDISESIANLTDEFNKVETSTSFLLDFKTSVETNGVSKVLTETGYTFDKDGLKITKTNSEAENTLTEKGMSITDNAGNEQLFAGYDDELGKSIVRSTDMTVRGYLVAGNHLRIEEYQEEGEEAGVGFFFI